MSEVSPGHLIMLQLGGRDSYGIVLPATKEIDVSPYRILYLGPFEKPVVCPCTIKIDNWNCNVIDFGFDYYFDVDLSDGNIDYNNYSDDLGVIQLISDKIVINAPLFPGSYSSHFKFVLDYAETKRVNGSEIALGQGVSFKSWQVRLLSLDPSAPGDLITEWPVKL